METAIVCVKIFNHFLTNQVLRGNKSLRVTPATWLCDRDRPITTRTLVFLHGNFSQKTAFSRLGSIVYLIL